MGRVVFLGTAHSIADDHHNNTHLVIQEGDRAIMVDCVGYPLLHLRRAGVDFHQITDLILTHFHPDHASGLPLFLLDMWLLHRKAPLTVHGIPHTIDRAEEMMHLHEWETWPGFFPVDFHRVQEVEDATILEDVNFRIHSSPVKHLLPTIGLRFDLRKSGKSVAYSSDTEPSPALVRLASGVDVLIHEATGSGIGHSSPEQAAQIARQAGAASLYLVHYPPDTNPDQWIGEARKGFSGKIILAQDQMDIPLD